LTDCNDIYYIECSVQGVPKCRMLFFCHFEWRRHAKYWHTQTQCSAHRDINSQPWVAVTMSVFPWFIKPCFIKECIFYLLISFMFTYFNIPGFY